MDGHVQQFQIANQLQLEKSTVVCNGCENWLQAPIYLHSDAKNYCEGCSSEVTTRNKALEDLLQNLIYPCKYCGYLEKQNVLLQHMRICEKGPITCILCEIGEVTDADLEEILINDEAINAGELLTYENIIDHVNDKHVGKVTNIEVDGVEATLQIDMPIHSQQLFLVNCIDQVDYSFVVLMKKKVNGLQFSVAAQSFKCKPPENVFSIRYKKTLACGIISDFRTMFNADQTTNAVDSAYLFIDDSQIGQIDVKISLRDDDTTMNILECPICYIRFSTDIYSCKNGHPVCSKCFPQITTCGLCRVDMNDVKFNIQRLFQNALLPCPNAAEGCLNFIQMEELEAHTKTCEFRDVQCPGCAQNFSKISIIKHIEVCVENLQNFRMKPIEELTWNSKNSTYFVQYGNELFQFDLMQEEGALHVRVKLLFTKDEKLAEAYRYEVHLMDVPFKTIACLKAMGVVSNDFSDVWTSIITKEKCMQLSIKDTLYVRCCIFETMPIDVQKREEFKIQVDLRKQEERRVQEEKRLQEERRVQEELQNQEDLRMQQERERQEELQSQSTAETNIAN